MVTGRTELPGNKRTHGNKPQQRRAGHERSLLLGQYSDTLLSLHCFQKAHGSLRSKSTFGSLVRLLGAVSDCWRAGKCFGYFLLCFGGWGEGGKAKTRGRSLKIHSGVHMSDWVS